MPLRTLDFLYQSHLSYPFLLKTNARPAIFIHIPKTGGTSINRALKLPQPDKSKQLSKHYTAQVIQQHLPEELWGQAFKFAIVRNPYERLYSHYQYRLINKRIRHNYGRNLDFSSWVKTVLPASEPNNLQPQYCWISNKEGQLLTDFVGKFEQLAPDFKHICQALALTEVTLPHLNKSTRMGAYLKAYDEESRAIAAAFYKKDLQLFNYEFAS